MKNKTTILIAVFVQFIMVLVMTLTMSCGVKSGIENDLEPEKYYQVKVIDNCEYIYVSRRPFAAEFSITHKGNCKYCAKRNQ